MRSIDRFALSFAPIFLRLAIGLTFLWTGAGKIFHYVELSPAQQTTLAQIESGSASPDTVLPPQGETLPDPEAEVPEAEIDPEPADAPAEDTERPRLRSLTDPSAAAPLHPGYTLVLAQDADTAIDDAEEEVAELVGENPAKRRFLVYVALTIHDAAYPEKGSPLVPAFIADNSMTFAWAVAIIEFVGGACLLIGFMTRLWACAITGVIGGVVWITGIGPAMMGGLDQTFLGFLPPVWPFDLGVGVHFFWTVGLMLAVASLVLLGGGVLSVDRILFGNPNKRNDGIAPDDVTNA